MSDFILSANFKKMIHYCQAIHAVLQEDLKIFTNDHQLEEIEKNNQKKMELIFQLIALVNEFKEKFPDGLAKIKHDNWNEEIQSLSDKLVLEANNCYKSIEENSNIISLNLRILNEIWQQAFALQDEKNIYDKKGSIVK